MPVNAILSPKHCYWTVEYLQINCSRL